MWRGRAHSLDGIPASKKPSQALRLRGLTKGPLKKMGKQEPDHVLCWGCCHQLAVEVNCSPADSR
jgi:hypothetical protein